VGVSNDQFSGVECCVALGQVARALGNDGASAQLDCGLGHGVYQGVDKGDFLSGGGCYGEGSVALLLSAPHHDKSRGRVWMTDAPY
jgi:hypothetical protein